MDDERQVAEAHAQSIGAAQLSVDLLLQNLPGTVYRRLNNIAFTMQFISNGVQKLTGYPPTEFTLALPPLSWASIIHPHDRAGVVAQLDSAMSQHRQFQLTYRIVTATGEIKWVWEQGAPIYDDCDAVVALEGFIADFTRTKSADALVIEQAALLDQARDAIFVVDISGRINYWNGGAERLFGWRPDEAIGMRVDELIELDSDELARACDHAVMDGEWCGEITHRRKNGSAVATEARWSLIPGNRATGGAQKILVITADISERKKAEARILRLAFFDALTELPNRMSLLENLHKALLNSVRNNHAIGALMFCDLDNFKTVNDSKGHAAGDSTLQAVARRLEHSVRETDLVARLGGDEFVVLLTPSFHSYSEAARRAEAVAENILRNLASPILLANESHQVSASIGITLFSGSVDTVESVMMKADSAMYQAKSAGRNTLRFFDPIMQATINAQQQLERDLAQALAKKEFTLYFQPQLNNRGHTVGAEALIRWIRPDGRVAMPREFIKAAEISGQIEEIDTWVLSTACLQLAQWAQEPRTRHLTLSVNISARKFVEPGFLSTAAAIFASTSVDPHRLRMELAESLLFNENNCAVTHMETLKECGVAFTLDDFGTGFSSLANLRKLPLDQLKIDYTFMQHIPDNRNDAAIARSIITLGKSLGIEVIAEGVETQAQKDFLAEAGCDCYQGFLFEGALANPDFIQFAQRTSASPPTQ